MRSQFDNLMGIIVTGFAERGEGTGGTSKILSGLTFPILTILGVQLIWDQQYILLAVLTTLVWTRASFLVMLGAAIYFIITQYWIGVGLLAGYFIIAFVSASFGRRNIRRLVFCGKPMISPFESMPDLLVILVFECLFLALALLTHGWVSVVLWSLFGIVALHHCGRYWFRLRPRWNQIHQPLMIRYAACAGREASQAETEQREFNFRTATHLLLKSVFPARGDEEIEDILKNTGRKMKSFSDRELLEQAIRKRNPSISHDTVATVLGKIEDHLQTDEGAKLIVRYAVAEIVESVFGIDERGKYLLAVIEGKAK